MIEFDQLDEQIVALLQVDGRTGNREIGRALNVSEGTIRKRLKRLNDLRAFRLTVLTDVRVLNWNAHAYVRLQVAPARARDVAQFIAGLDGCGFAAFSVGRFNVNSFLMAQDRYALMSVIDREIAVLEGVHDIDVRESVHTAKHRFDLVRIT